VIAAEELARLWRLHAAALTMLCRSRCNSPEDCVQEAFVRLAHQDPVPNDLVAWLSRVARNEAIDRARSEARRRQRERQFQELRPQWFADSDVVDPGEERGEEIQLALEQLDLSVREVVIAHIWGGMTFRQIAEAFGISRSTANRHYQQGLASLRQSMDGSKNEIENCVKQQQSEKQL